MKQKDYLKVKLPTAFKFKWVKALRSGKYKQGATELYNKTDNTYCCLGVAGVLCGIKENDLSNEGVFEEASFDRDILKKIPKILVSGEDGNRLVSKLIDMNDSGKHSFNRIAAYIDRYL